MKISTVVVVKIVDAITFKELSEASGPSSSVIIPRKGEFIELSVLDTDSGKSVDTLFVVSSIGHKYTESYRNIITIYVNKVKK
jgi:hypothetical protein